MTADLRMLTAAQAAEEMGVSTDTVRHLVANAGLPTIDVGRTGGRGTGRRGATLRIAACALHRWLLERSRYADPATGELRAWALEIAAPPAPASTTTGQADHSPATSAVQRP